MAFFFPTRQFDPRIKPPQWGPTTSVQAAMRDNCQRLGLPLPVSMFPLWEDAGTIVYDVVRSKAVSATFAAVTEWRTGGIRFHDNEENYISDDTVAALVSSAAGTMRLRFICVGTSAYGHYLMSMRVGSGQRYYLRRSGFDFTYGWDDTYNHDTGFNFVQDSTYDIAMTWNSSGCVIYCNGTQVDTQGGENAQPDSFAIGALSSSPNNGVDQLALSADVYDQQLTADQIALLHEQPYALIQPVARPLMFDVGAAEETTKIPIFMNSYKQHRA